MILALAKSKSYKNAGNSVASDKLLVVVQCSLIGSIFSNSLLVLGCSFLANGFYYEESTFNTAVTSANVTLLLVSSFVMILPAPYHTANNLNDELMVSRAAACALLVMYGCLLFFVLHTHKHIVDPEANKNNGKNVSTKNGSPEQNDHQEQNDRKYVEMNTFSTSQQQQFPNQNQIDDSHSSHKHTHEVKDTKLTTLISKEQLDLTENDEDDDDDLSMSMIGALLLLLFTTILVSLLSEYLVNALEPMSEALGMSEAFIGLILLPIIGNAVEHITSIRMAIKNKMDIALSIAIGSATQVAMFVVSLSVLIAWAMDLDLALDFDSFEVNMFIYTSIIIFAITSDGHSNWLEGAMLICLYCLIGIAVWDQKFTE